MHRLPSLAVGYIHIVTHSGLACNYVVSSHTKPGPLLWSTWPYRGVAMRTFTPARSSLARNDRLAYSRPAWLQINGHAAYVSPSSKLVRSITCALALRRRDKGKPAARR